MTHEQRLENSRESGTQFGTDVDLAGDVLAVGAPWVGLNSGAVFMYRHDGGQWNLEQTLEPTDPDLQRFMGDSVAISDQAVIAGAPLEDTFYAINGGSAYVFPYDGTQWTSGVRVLPTSSYRVVHFGQALAADGDRMGGVG